MQPMNRYRFYCGLTSKDGQTVPSAKYHEAMRLGGYPNYTVYDARGSWEGVRENTLVIEILSPIEDMHPDLARCLAERLRIAGNQSAVLLTWDMVETALVC